MAFSPQPPQEIEHEITALEGEIVERTEHLYALLAELNARIDSHNAQSLRLSLAEGDGYESARDAVLIYSKYNLEPET